MLDLRHIRVDQEHDGNESCSYGYFTYKVSQAEDGASEVMLSGINGNRTKKECGKLASRYRNDSEMVRSKDKLCDIKPDDAGSTDDSKYASGAQKSS